MVRILVPGIIFGVILGRFLLKKPEYLELMDFRSWKEKAEQADRNRWIRIVSLSIIFGISTFFLVQGTASIMEEFWSAPIGEDSIFGLIPLPILIFSITVIPIFEEWVFRGVILEEVSQVSRSKIAGLIFSSLLFALFHLSNPGTNLSAVPPYFIGGLIMGGGYLADGLAVATFSHIIYNLFPYIVTLIFLLF